MKITVHTLRAACLAMLTGLAALSGLSGCAHGGARAGERGTPSAEQLLQVADLAERGGDPLRAQQYLLAALREGADEQKHLPRLLNSYVADGQYRVAVELLENHLRRHPDAVQMRVLLSTLYTATGNYEGAIQQYERVIARAPRDAYAHFALASLLHDSGVATARADQHYRTYLELAPDGAHAEEARGLLLTEIP
jgi:tetratricopeptide (TPR) repeat protein